MAKRKNEKYKPAKRTIETAPIVKPIQKWPAGFSHEKYYWIRKKFKSRTLRGAMVQPVGLARDEVRLKVKLINGRGEYEAGHILLIHPKFLTDKGIYE